MEVDLYTRSGELVGRVTVLPYKTMPDVLLWGQRTFIRRDDGKYYEGFVGVVIKGPKAPKAEGDEPQTCPRRAEGPHFDVKDEDQWSRDSWRFTDPEEARKWNEEDTARRNAEYKAAGGADGSAYCNPRYYLWPGPGPMPRTCSYCGSLHPEDALALKRDHKYEVERSTKGYKVYMHLPGYGVGTVNVMANMQAGVDPVEALKGQETPEVYPPMKAYSMHFTREQWKKLLS